MQQRPACPTVSCRALRLALPVAVQQLLAAPEAEEALQALAQALQQQQSRQPASWTAPLHTWLQRLQPLLQCPLPGGRPWQRTSLASMAMCPLQQWLLLPLLQAALHAAPRLLWLQQRAALQQQEGEGEEEAAVAVAVGAAAAPAAMSLQMPCWQPCQRTRAACRRLCALCSAG
jgi:hypothetical protein